MSSTFEYACVTPKKTCSGANCYCFSGKDQFNLEMSTISSVSSPAPNEGFYHFTEHIMCDTNCMKAVKPLEQYITFKGCIFCDEECKKNFTGLFQDEVHREDSFSYEPDNDAALRECELCLSLKEEEEIFYCGGCELSSCLKCRETMMTNGGQDCFEGTQEEYFCPACYKNMRRHLFFDENGNEITRQQFLQQQEDKGWGFYLPDISCGIARHPRVLLNFLRYVDSHNEVATADDLIFLNPIPSHIYESMLKHSSIQNPTLEFEADVNELIERLGSHLDCS